MLETLRKFGLGFCDLPTMIWNSSVLLRVLTLNIDARNKKKIPIIFYIVTVTSMVCYFYVYLFGMIWFVFWRCAQTGDVLAALVIFSLGSSSEIGTVRLFFMFFYRDKVKEIVAECLAFDRSVDFNSRFYKNLLSRLRVVKKRAMAFWIVIMGNAVVYILMPILTPGRHMTEDHLVLYGLEPMYETPNYQIAFLISSAGVIVISYLTANIQGFSIIIIGYIEAQMLAITEEMIHLYRDANNNSKDNYDETESKVAERNRLINEFIEKHLKEIAKRHSRNINILKQVEHVFSGGIILEFALLTIGLISELLGGLENTYLQLPFALMQVGMDCFTGQRVMDASERFEAAVYGCKWEKFDRANMKLVLTMLQNAQKTMKLSAGGLATLSFQCFMTVIRCIYSAYTTLRTTIDN